MAGLVSRIIGAPPTVVLERREPIHAPDAFPQVSVRREVPVATERAPQPVAAGTFSAVGHDAEHATPHVWLYQSLAIPEILSVMGWPFGVAKVPSAAVVSMPRGMQNPISGRTNIQSPKQTTLGDLTAVQGVSSPVSLALSKIAF